MGTTETTALPKSRTPDLPSEDHLISGSPLLFIKLPISTVYTDVCVYDDVFVCKVREVFTHEPPSSRLSFLSYKSMNILSLHLLHLTSPDLFQSSTTLLL